MGNGRSALRLCCVLLSVAILISNAGTGLALPNTFYTEDIVGCEGTLDTVNSRKTSAETASFEENPVLVDRLGVTIHAFDIYQAGYLVSQMVFPNANSQYDCSEVNFTNGVPYDGLLNGLYGMYSVRDGYGRNYPDYMRDEVLIQPLAATLERMELAELPERSLGIPKTETENLAQSLFGTSADKDVSKFPPYWFNGMDWNGYCYPGFWNIDVVMKQFVPDYSHNSASAVFDVVYEDYGPALRYPTYRIGLDIQLGSGNLGFNVCRVYRMNDGELLPEQPSPPETNDRYRIVCEVMSWSQAKEYCEDLGGHLATITSDEEQRIVDELNVNKYKLWIGGRRDDSGEWQWITGEKWDYTNWASGEPNNSSNVLSNENSVAIWPSQWNDLNENNLREQQGFICEWENTGALPVDPGKPDVTEPTPSRPDDRPTFIKILTGYNAASGTVKFKSLDLDVRTDGVDNKLNVESSVPEDLSSLVGSYVCVTYQPYDEEKYDPVYISFIEPVEPKFGLVTQVNAGGATSAVSTIVIDGATYTSSLSGLSTLKNTKILYFVRNGQLLAYFPTGQITGKLTAVTSTSLTVSDTQLTRGALTPSLPGLDGATGLYVVAQSAGGQLVGLEIPSTVSISAPNAFLTGQGGRIILSGQYGSGQNGAGWTVRSSDPSVISFGGNAETSSPETGTALSQFRASVPVIAHRSGKAVLICTLADGTEQRVNVQVMTQEERELQERLKEWELTFQAYMKNVQNAANEAAAAQPDEAELRELATVLLSKLKGEYGLQLTPQMGKETPEMQVAVCSAVLQLLHECYSSAPEISRPKTPAEIVTETLEASVNLKTTYTNSETGETVNVTINGIDIVQSGASSPKIGQAVYWKDGKSVVTVISGDLASLAKAAGDFMNDLDKIYGSIGEDALKTCSKEIVKCAFGMSLSKMMESGAEAMLSKHSDTLRKLGVGEVLTIYKAGKQVYGLTFGLKATDILDPSGMAKKIDDLAAFSFKESSAVQEAAKTLIGGLKQATKNVAKSLRKLSGSISPVPVESVIKALFQCPVDVEIYNTSGKQIGFIGDSAPSWSEGNLTVGYLGEAKQIISEGEALVFKVSGTGWGTMSCMVEEVSNGIGTSRAVYYDLPLTPSASYSVRTPASGVSPDTIEVQQGTSPVCASMTLDSAHYADAAYSVVAEPSDAAAGTVIGSGSYVAGDAVVLCGEPNAGYSFDWWEDSDGTLLSLDSTYQFTATGPVSIIAVFSEDTDYVPATPDPPAPTPGSSPTPTPSPQPPSVVTPAPNSPTAVPAPSIPTVTGYQGGLMNNRPYYARTSGFSTMYYLKSSSGRIARVSAPYAKAGGDTRYYPINHGGTVLFPRVEDGRVTCFCVFADNQEKPVLVAAADASRQQDAAGYQTGTINGKTYYVKTSGASTMFYLRSSSGRMARVSAPYITDAHGTRYYPVNYGGAVLFPKLVNGTASYVAGSGKEVLVVM